MYVNNSGLYDKHPICNENIIEMWDFLLTSFISRDRIGSPERLIPIYEFLCRLNESQKLHRSIDPEIEILKGRMKKKVDLLWRYNIEEKRLYTYKELKARRNDYQYVADENAPWEKQQWLSIY